MSTDQMQQMVAAFSVFSHVPRPMAAEAVSSPANAVSWVRWIGHERWVVVLTWEAVSSDAIWPYLRMRAAEEYSSRDMSSSSRGEHRADNQQRAEARQVCAGD